MHGTHRFFLTERSLYLLVMGIRREDDRSIYDWLRSSASAAATHRDRRGQQVRRRSTSYRLDEAGLRQTYPSIVPLSAPPAIPDEDERGRFDRRPAHPRSRTTLYGKESARLKHVRDPIPQSWLRVKDAIAELTRSRRSVLPVRDFERLCEAATNCDSCDRRAHHGPDEQRALLATVARLGRGGGAWPAARCAPPVWPQRDHGPRSQLVDRRAIYALINSPMVRDQDGELSHGDQLGTLLDPARIPGAMARVILGMIEVPEFGLCLELPGTDHQRYLFPEALPVKEPDYGNWPEDALRFRFPMTCCRRA